MKPWAQILVAMIIGGGAGLVLNLLESTGALEREVVLQVAGVGSWIGGIFLGLLSMVVVPLIVSSLVGSVLSVGAQGGLRRLGTKTLVYYLSTSAVAIATGVLMVNLVKPGVGVDYGLLMQAASAEMATVGKSAPDVAEAAGAGAFGTLVGIFDRMIPRNIIGAASSNKQVLPVIFFTLCFSAAALGVEERHRLAIQAAAEAIYATMERLVAGILRLAPLGIGAYLFAVTAATGMALAGALLGYMVAVALSLMVHGLITLPLFYWVFTKKSPWVFMGQMREALLTAFGTASSAGTLPVTMRCAAEAGVSKRVTAFTLPLGATVNMDGTALYEAVAVLFVAQMRGDVDLVTQIIIAITALLASIGAAGIPHAGTVMMVIVMEAAGLPTDAVLVILAVDRVLDMARTTINVWSDSVGAAVIGHSEGV